MILYYDVTELAKKDKGTGIQRVVRALMEAFLSDDGFMFSLVLVVGDGEAGEFYQLSKLSGDGRLILSEHPVKPQRGDIYLCADLTYNMTETLSNCLRRYRQDGVRVVFVVYDLIPIHHPQWFAGLNDWFEGNDYLGLFNKWFEYASLSASALMCISRSVCVDVKNRMKMLDAPQIPDIGYFHLGHDIGCSKPTTGFPPNHERVLNKISQSRSFLMVGTLEPRKCHHQAIDAMELLWAQGHDDVLVIVGKDGWLSEDIVSRIRGHKKFGANMFWLDGISDQYLEKVYLASSAVLALSLDEGFGLPLVEAMNYDLPVIARDIPVFREVLGGYGQFFSGQTGSDLIQLLLNYEDRRGRDDLKSDAAYQTWTESARQLIDTIEMLVPVA